MTGLEFMRNSINMSDYVMVTTNDSRIRFLNIKNTLPFSPGDLGGILTTLHFQGFYPASFLRQLG